jgi:hypothetical protein
VGGEELPVPKIREKELRIPFPGFSHPFRGLHRDEYSSSFSSVFFQMHIGTQSSCRSRKNPLNNNNIRILSSVARLLLG